MLSHIPNLSKCTVNWYLYTPPELYKGDTTLFSYFYPLLEKYAVVENILILHFVHIYLLHKGIHVILQGKLIQINLHIYLNFLFFFFHLHLPLGLTFLLVKVHNIKLLLMGSADSTLF